MTDRMRRFLAEAAEAAPGKGIPVTKYDARIASKAVNDGYGWMIEFPLRVFIIDDRGRKALAA